VAFAGKNRPDELEEADLGEIAVFMAEQYVKNPLRGFLTVAFPNSGFTQPAFFKQPDKQQTYIDRVLYAYRQDRPTLDESGVFMNLPAADVTFDVYGKLEPGRIFRQHIPLQTGEGVINFHPYGDAGLPVSGLALFAVQAYPLGSAKCAGRTLSVHSDNPEIMVHFARRFLEENRHAIHTAQLEKSKKMPEPHLKQRTLIIKILIEALDKQLDSQEDNEPFSITVYHLTNSGQGADLAIYHLPSQLIEYLAEIRSASYRQAWQQIERAAWVRFKPKRGQKEAPPDFKPNRNWLYEDLFNLVDDPYRNGRRFIRTYFLREARRYADATDPRGTYSTQKEAHLVSWQLTERFLRRILYMDSERIEQIRHLGDALAAYVKAQNDKRFFRAFYVENRYGYLRNSLIKANTAHVKGGHEPFLTLDNYISVFEEGEELASQDWRLARDLVLIRMVEQLYKNGWLGRNEDAIPEVEEEES
jgi:CRISPR-associated protein Cst1